jgi:hypothetical protein
MLLEQLGNFIGNLLCVPKLTLFQKRTIFNIPKGMETRDESSDLLFRFFIKCHIGNNHAMIHIQSCIVSPHFIRFENKDPIQNNATLSYLFAYFSQLQMHFTV